MLLEAVAASHFAGRAKPPVGLVTEWSQTNGFGGNGTIPQPGRVSKRLVSGSFPPQEHGPIRDRRDS